VNLLRADGERARPGIADMSREVEVSLRVPNMKVRVLDETGYPIDHANMRFRKMIQVPAIPKPEAMLELSTRSGKTIPARVVRADWSEGRELFVVSCQYSNRSITAEEYNALAEDPEWELKPLI
jgi:hypothetical protein